MEKTDKEKIQTEESATLSPIRVDSLRCHFKITYKLKDGQIDLLLASSARSLKNTLTAAGEAFNSPNSFEILAHQAHTMKGLLLNMGEPAWASRARTIELSAIEKKELDYRELLDEIIEGVQDVLSLCVNN